MGATLPLLTSLQLSLGSQLGLYSQTVLAIVDNQLPLLIIQFVQLLVIGIVGEEVFKLYLKRGVFLNEEHGVEFRIIDGFVVPDEQHGEEDQHGRNDEFFHDVGGGNS